MPEAKRTLVKSGPELWAELTDPGALARHLGPFGSVRIARTQPETLVEWEGDRASGTVRLEPSGFGTRVVLTARTPAGAEPDPEPEPEPAPEPARRSLLARLFRRAPAPPPAPAEPPPAPEAEVAGMDEAAVERILTDCLDALGSARHRPFSRI